MATQAERWRKIEEVYFSALDCPEQDRDALIDALCADEQLRREVKRLLDPSTPNAEVDGKLFQEIGMATHDIPIWPGDHVGPYEVVRPLGSGGMGVVFLAHDTRLRRNVALKVLRNDPSTEASNRFVQEARAASALNHPNIAAIYDIAERDGRQFIVSEYVDGVTLRERLGSGPLDVAQVRSILTQLSSALESAHTAGIVHRDLKPENILVRSDGAIKIVDFGLAKLGLTGDAAGTSTASGVLIGTLPYMSPEQARGGRIDARTDIWSTGVVVYELLSGVNPFAASSPAETLSRIAVGESGPLPESVPADLALIVEKMLQKDLSRRYGAMREVGIQLGGSPPGRSKGRSKWIAVGAVALMVAAVGLASRLILSRRNTLRPQTMVLLTNNGRVNHAAISPDGKYVAYSAADDHEGEALWLRQAGAGSESIRLPSEAVQYLGIGFSPESDFIVYSLYRQGGLGFLYRTPLVGGDPRLVAKDVDGPPAVSPDGSHVAFVRLDAAHDRSYLVACKMDGSDERILVTRPSATPFIGAVAWLSNGDLIATVRRRAHQRTEEAVLEVPAGGGNTPFESSRAFAFTGALASLGDERFLVAAADFESPPQVLRIEARGDSFDYVTRDAGGYTDISIAASEQFVAVQNQRTAGIWIGAGPRYASVHKLTPGVARYLGASWTPGGEVLTRTQAGVHPQIWSIPADTGRGRAIGDDSRSQANPRACPDGRFILFTSTSDGLPKIWRMDADGRNARRLTGSAAKEGAPVCGSDSRSVVFTSDESGIQTLWRVAIDGGRVSQLTTWTSFYPEISPNGEYIACRSFDEDRSQSAIVAVVRARDGSLMKKIAKVPQSSSLRWGPSPREISFVRTSDGVSNLFAISIDGEIERQITHFANDRIFAFDWSSDGRRLALVKGTEASDVVLSRPVKF